MNNRSDRRVCLGPPLSRSACRFTKPIAGFVGALRLVLRSSNRSQADERVLAVLRPEGSLPFGDNARSGSLGLPDGDHCACVVELVRLSRVLPTVSRICFVTVARADALGEMRRMPDRVIRMSWGDSLSRFTGHALWPETPISPLAVGPPAQAGFFVQKRNLERQAKPYHRRGFRNSYLNQVI